MKILSVFIAILFVLSSGVTANANETDAPVMYPLGDVNFDGEVTADDARFILRSAVGLESASQEGIVYSDCDSDGSVGASDARLALRASVGLEEMQGFSFEITDAKASTCSEEGYIKARCAVTGVEKSISVKKLSHALPENIGCTGKGKCTVCGEDMTCEIKHSWAYAYWKNTRECYYCGVKESFIHVHNFGVNEIYCECGISARAIFSDEMKEYLPENGLVIGDEYYIEEYVEPVLFALVYNENVDITYVFCCFSALVNEDMWVDYEFEFNFDTDTVIAKVFAADMCVAMISGSVNPEKVTENCDGDAITIYGYEAIPGLNGMEAFFRMLMEGVVYDSALWLTETAPTVGCTYAEYLFADYVNVK